MAIYYAGNSQSVPFANDSNLINSLSTPWTIEKCVLAADSGSTIYVLPSSQRYFNTSLVTIDKQINFQAFSRGSYTTDPLGDAQGSWAPCFTRTAVFDARFVFGSQKWNGSGPITFKNIGFTFSPWPDSSETWNSVSGVNLSKTSLIKTGIYCEGVTFDGCEFWKGYGSGQSQYVVNFDNPTTAAPNLYYPELATPKDYYLHKNDDGTITDDITQAKLDSSSNPIFLSEGWGYLGSPSDPNDGLYIWEQNGSPTYNPIYHSPSLFDVTLSVPNTSLIAKNCYIHDFSKVGGVTTNASGCTFEISGSLIERIFSNCITFGGRYNFKKHYVHGCIVRGIFGHSRDQMSPDAVFTSCDFNDLTSDNDGYTRIKNIEYSNNLVYAMQGQRAIFRGHEWLPSSKFPYYVEGAKIRRSFLYGVSGFVSIDLGNACLIDRCIGVSETGITSVSIDNSSNVPEVSSIVHNTLIDDCVDTDRLAKKNVTVLDVRTLTDLFPDATTTYSSAHELFEAYKPRIPFTDQGTRYDSVRSLVTSPRDFTDEEPYLGIMTVYGTNVNTAITSEKCLIHGGNAGSSNVSISVSNNVTWSELSSDDASTVIQVGNSSISSTVTVGNYLLLQSMSSSNNSTVSSSTITLGSNTFTWTSITRSSIQFPSIVFSGGKRLQRTAPGMEVANDNKLSMAVVFKPYQTANTVSLLTTGTTAGITLSQAGNKVKFVARDNTSATLLDVTSNGASLANNAWNTVLFSTNFGDKRFNPNIPAMIYINDIFTSSFNLSNWNTTAGAMNWNGLAISVGSSGGANTVAVTSDAFSGEIGMIALWLGEFVDWSDPNKRALISPDFIGTNGESVTGNRPSIFITGKVTDAESTNANRGKGGALIRMPTTAGSNFTAGAGISQQWPIPLTITARTSTSVFNVDEPIDIVFNITGTTSTFNITPTSDMGGTWNPSTVVWGTGEKTATARFTPSAMGTHTISFTNNAGYVNPDPIQIEVGRVIPFVISPAAGYSGSPLKVSLRLVLGHGGSNAPVINGSFANVQNGTAYSNTIPISGGTGPYTVSVVSGQLPPSMTLSVSGSNIILSGTEN